MKNECSSLIVAFLDSARWETNEKPLHTAFTWLQIGQHDLASRKQTAYILRLEEDTLKAFRKNVKNEEANRSKATNAMCTKSALNSHLNSKP